MNLTFGTVLPREELVDTDALTFAVPSSMPERPPRGAVIHPEVVAAASTAQRIVQDAEARAAEILARAEAELESLRARVESDARAEGAAAVAEKTLLLAAREANVDERATERWIGLARLLAERLLGEALVLDPSRIVSLAETALAEARGARQVTLVANPDDAALLQQALARGGLSRVTRLVENAERPRGSLRFETEIGVLDAAIAPQLDRLAARLRETLHHER